MSKDFVLKEMTVLEKILKTLEDNKCVFTRIDHAPVYTSEDAAKIRDFSLSTGAKAIVCLGDTVPILIVVPGNCKIDFKAFKKLFGYKDLRMATKEEVLSITTLEIGSIPPMGSVMSLKSYYDESIKRKDYVAFNAGSHSVSVKISARELIAVENPMFGDFALVK